MDLTLKFSQNKANFFPSNRKYRGKIGCNLQFQSHRLGSIPSRPLCPLIFSTRLIDRHSRLKLMIQDKR